MRVDLADKEPLVGDERLWLVRETLEREFPDLRDETKLATMYQEPSSFEGRDVAAMAVFLAVSPNPRALGFKIIHHAVASYKDFQDSDRERLRMVGRPDPVLQIYRTLLPHHLRALQNLREMN